MQFPLTWCNIAALFVGGVISLLPIAATAEEGNNSVISQIGDENRASIQQKYVGSGTATPQQNTAQVYQAGAGNRIDISQDGDALTTTVTQNGSNNSGSVVQYGAGGTSTITQDGDHQKISVEQRNPFGGPIGSVIVHQF